MRKLSISTDLLFKIFQDGNLFVDTHNNVETQQIHTDVRTNWTMDSCYFDSEQDAVVMVLNDRRGGKKDVKMELLTLDDCLERLKQKFTGSIGGLGKGVVHLAES